MQAGLQGNRGVDVLVRSPGGHDWLPIQKQFGCGYSPQPQPVDAAFWRIQSAGPLHGIGPVEGGEMEIAVQERVDPLEGRPGGL